MALALINGHLDSQVRCGLFSMMIASFSSLSDFFHFSFGFVFPIIVLEMFKFWFSN